MKKKIILTILIFVLFSVSINAHPLASDYNKPVWMEFSLGFSMDIQNKQFKIEANNLEMNFYYKEYSGFGIGMNSGDMYGFYASALHLFQLFDTDYLLFPVKFKAGYYFSYNEGFPGFTLSAGAKGILEIPGESGSPLYFITDLLGSISYYHGRPTTGSPINIYAEIYPGLIMEVSDE